MSDEFNYQLSGRYFAQCGRELEPLVEAELKELGADPDEKLRGGVYFRATAEALYRVNYCSRLASRILAPLAAFPCPSENELYRLGFEIAWEKILDPGRTFAIFSQVSRSRISHSQYASLKLKDAIVDRFLKRTGRRPSVDRQDPDIWLNLNIHDDHAVISLDTSNGPLHRRGYRIHGGEAPLQETLAAAVIRLSGWHGERPLHDPLCGSGTLLGEALMLAGQTPAGFLRERFGFEQLPDFDRSLWGEVKKSQDGCIRAVREGLISGSDIDGRIVKAARANLNRLPAGKQVNLFQSDFRDLTVMEDRTLVANLPYGVRMGDRRELEGMYKEFGDFLKKRCRGGAAFVLCGSIDLIGRIGLAPSRRIPLYNGPIECRLLKFEIY